MNGAPLTTNMLSWAKQHVEWSLAAGDYQDPNGVLMTVIDVNGDALMSVGPYEPLADRSRDALVARAEDLAAGDYQDPNGVLMTVIDVNGDALMSVGPYEPLADRSRDALVARAEEARREQAKTGVAPELLASVTPEGRMLVFAAPDEHLCGAATLVEQLAATQGREAVRTLGDGARLADALAVVEEGSVVFLISDEHGVVVEDEQAAAGLGDARGAHAGFRRAR